MSNLDGVDKRFHKYGDSPKGDIYCYRRRLKLSGKGLLELEKSGALDVVRATFTAGIPADGGVHQTCTRCLREVTHYKNAVATTLS